MSAYIFGILLVFFAITLHAGANIIDSNFSNQLFKRVSSIVFFSELVGLVFLPVVIFISHPAPVSLGIAGLILICAAIETLYLFPYYWSFRETDTSVVASLFSLGKIFVPTLAFFIVGERLAPLQYVGIVIIIFSSIALTFDFKQRRLNQAFFMMLGVSIMLAVESVLYKYIFDQGVSWGTVIFWASIFQFLIAASFMFSPKNRVDLGVARNHIKSFGYLFILEEALSWFGEVASIVAISLIPVSIVEGVGAAQPLFVLLYALLFKRIYPKLFKESTELNDMAHKSVYFGLIIIGTIVIVMK